MTKEQPAPKEEISNQELITAVYQKILQEHSHQELDFGEVPPASLIADDSDYHRSARGFMLYDRVSWVSFGDKPWMWILALGTRTRGYPANEFDFDFKAFPFEPDGEEGKLTDKLRRKIGSLSFFQKSLLAGVRGRGTLHDGDYPPSVKIAEQLKPQIRNFVAQWPKLDPRYANHLFHMVPIMEQSVRYRPEFVEVVARTIVKVLEEI